MYRIVLPSCYAQDFLSALGVLGTELDSELRDEAGETAIIYIQLTERK